MNVNKVSSTFWIVECPVSDFRVTMLNAAKKVSGKKNYANASFFSYFDEKSPKGHFTLPIGHVVCDCNLDTSKGNHYWCNHYMRERGPSSGSRCCFDGSAWSYMNPQFHGKSLTTLTIKNGVANIQDLRSIDLSYTYAIMGVPLMKNGADVSWANYVKPQGWLGSELYATYHTILAIKEPNAKVIYIIGWKSTTGNLVSSGEAYKKLKAYGFYSAIKLDGGGSMVLDVNGSRMATAENRHINTIIEFGPRSTTTQTTTNAAASTTTSTTPSSTSTWASAVTTANVNMRSGPSTNYPSLLVVPKGSTIRVDRNYTNSSWHRAAYNGVEGYISKTYVRVTTTQTSTPITKSNPYTVPTRTLKFGCKGDDVKWLQTGLQLLGYNVGNSGVDGEFGSATRSAVKSFQSDNRLVVDGYFGAASRAKMQALIGQ